MLLHGVSVVEQAVPPVGVGVVAPLVASVDGLADYPGTLGVLGLVVHAGEEFHHIFVGVEDIVGTFGCHTELVDGVNRPVTGRFIIRGSGRFLPSEAAAVTYGGLALGPGAFLGSDQNHAECCTGSVNCGRGGILDDGNGFHVVGVHTVDVSHGAVDEHERGRSVDGSEASDVQRARASGITGRCGDVQARDGTLEHGGQGVGGTVLQFLSLHSGHGSGEVHLFLGTVTDDDGLFEYHVIFCQRDVHHVLPGGNTHALGGVTEAGENEYDVAGRNAECPASVGIRDRSRGRAFQNDSYAGQRLVCAVENLSGYCTVLGLQSHAG